MQQNRFCSITGAACTRCSRSYVEPVLVLVLQRPAASRTCTYRSSGAPGWPQLYPFGGTWCVAIERTWRPPCVYGLPAAFAGVLGPWHKARLVITRVLVAPAVHSAFNIKLFVVHLPEPVLPDIVLSSLSKHKLLMKTTSAQPHHSATSGDRCVASANSTDCSTRWANGVSMGCELPRCSSHLRHVRTGHPLWVQLTGQGNSMPLASKPMAPRHITTAPSPLPITVNLVRIIARIIASMLDYKRN